jgi:hypothetical protein
LRKNAELNSWLETKKTAMSEVIFYLFSTFAPVLCDRLCPLCNERAKHKKSQAMGKS